MSTQTWNTPRQWGVLLEYLNPSTEAEFIKNFNTCSFNTDVMNHTIMILLGCTFSFVMTIVNGVTLGVNLFLICITVSSLRLCFMLKKRDIYLRHRTMILMASHILHATLSTLSSSYMPMPAYKSLPCMIMYLMRTPVMILNMVGVGMSIPIKNHVFSTFLACLASSIWIIIFCNRCQHVDHAYPITASPGFFPDLSRSITDWLHRSTIIGALIDLTSQGQPRPDPTPITSCWVPMVFLHLAVGYFFPCAVVYCAEAYQRALFISRRQFQAESDMGTSSGSELVPVDADESDMGVAEIRLGWDRQTVVSPSRIATGSYVWYDFRSTVLMGLWIMFMMVQAVWIFLRGIGEAFELRKMSTDGELHSGFCPNANLSVQYYSNQRD